MGRLGLAGLLVAMLGTYLIAATGYFGFLAPVLAKQSPAVLDAITEYSPVQVSNGLAAIAFMVGHADIRHRHGQDSDPAAYVWGFVAVGAPLHLLGFGISQLISTAAWAVAVVGAVGLGFGLARPGYRLWQTPPPAPSANGRRRPFGPSC